ncbi:hypothetical protein HDU67_008876 [Dinochytrium kinnereticum]|nr:hypothetical protein HDU67_008876 [Dinochytrium kinnereticum]
MTADIQLYLAGTPNGKKIPILLEELDIPYDMHFINFAKKDQFTPEFLKISPNNKIPAIVDLHPPFDHDKPVSVFESAAILQYLADVKAPPNSVYPKDHRARVATNEWLYWQISGLGPMMGQRGHFTKFAPEQIPYAIKRFSEENERLFGVMEKRLSAVDYFNGYDFSIADIAIYPWAAAYEYAGIEISAYPNLKKWLDRVSARPSVKTALAKTDSLTKA